jgi:hypothetical protein
MDRPSKNYQRFQITPFFEMKSGRGARKQRKERHEGADWGKESFFGFVFLLPK